MSRRERIEARLGWAAVLLGLAGCLLAWLAGRLAWEAACVALAFAGAIVPPALYLHRHRQRPECEDQPEAGRADGGGILIEWPEAPDDAWLMQVMAERPTRHRLH